ncbi:CHAT domain-containing protein [Halorussus halophilus]|uniref:hypothetical protein n=1 Tax=Halorussus halophilus TaxID=2650975 RepID=UPI0013012C81|nr:hypothetical protein [Halorussus halophilus]
MIEWEETESGLRVYDRTKTEVCIDAEDWVGSDADYEIERPVDGTVSGYVSELRLPSALVTASSLTSDDEYKHGGDAETLQLSADDYLLNIEANIKTYLRFSGPATISKSEDFSELHIGLPDETLVTFGFRSFNEEPVETITVPPTPEGVATAITYSSATHKTDGPMRSYPTLRSHPPRIEVGKDTEIPDAVRDERFETGIEVVVPDELRYTFVAAPLAYYLQAEMTVADCNAPVLKIPETGVEHEFESLPQFQHEVVDMLRRVFFLDCLVRNEGYYSWDLAEMELLDTVGIDAERAYDATPAERLTTYLDAPYERIDDELPEWHLAMHVEPTVDNVSCLPYFLNNLAIIYLPESSDLEKEELLNKSIGDFYRAGDVEPPKQSLAQDTTVRAGAGSVKSVDRRDPVLHEGRVNGWLADGVPIDVFKVVPETYENKFKYFDHSDGDIDVTVILNDEEMINEHEDVANIYRERAEELPIDVTVKEYLTKQELAEVLESHHDFVHYIGHCEESGLRCSNGNLSVSDIEECNVQTFFLNACGSYYEGHDLVEKGSVAGAVTFTKVLNKQAAKVGVTFARLLINGFNIDLALRYARRRIMMGKDYAVVGDGSHVLTQTGHNNASILYLEEQDGEYEIQSDYLPLHNNGIIYYTYFKDENKAHLQGNKVAVSAVKSEAISAIRTMNAPVIYDGEIYWSNELIKKLR